MNVGDKVSWVKVSTKGRAISMRHQEGEVVAIQGDTATVKTKSGKLVRGVPVAALRLVGQKGQLTEFVEELAAHYRQERAN